ncbi:sulfurtransferase TusA family protein [Natrinema sp. 1APR25-10V2]|uniref:sulfurtransferase TusA family protein n=1 Tax=Natrinema sp. 1APR25-10V2 TaxID=2951081 RepID=UPI002875EEB3|nr:sulfurtransferase TusA family protein [Natrinema sp. 1APR25-10V2]MDS0477283.1 sulfurtransferase TusA family protein [Natrinema sp. 1APR25-10V2]
MEIDVSGTVCPQTVLIVRRCLEELEPGDELTVVGDYPPAERSIRRSCHKHGYSVSTTSTTDAEAEFALRIRVTSAAKTSATHP